MPVYQDQKSRTWRCLYRVRGVQYQKRGFKTKKEALGYERRQLMSSSGDMKMLFKAFYEDCYTVDKFSNCKPTTIRTNDNIVYNHIIPFFGDMRMVDITSRDIIMWMNCLKKQNNPEGYSNSYLRTVYKCLKAIFNHAEKHFSLPNPMKKTENFSKGIPDKKTTWTIEQYKRFSTVVRNEGTYIETVLFDTLFFTGMRKSEMLALTIGDINIKNKSISVNKNLQVMDGKELLLSPKTLSSFRDVPIPDFLADELREYISRLPVQTGDVRLFQISRNTIARRLASFSAVAQVPKITLHGFRHSYITLMLHQNISPTDLCKIVGHSSPITLYRYSHEYREMQMQMMKKLDTAWNQLSE